MWLVGPTHPRLGGGPAPLRGVARVGLALE